MFKKIGILTILMCIAISMYAKVPLKDHLKLKGVNKGWFMGAGVGTQFYVGDSDNLQKTGYRFSTAMEGNVGKWITPSIAARLQGTLARVTGGDIQEKPDAMNLINIHADCMVDVLNFFMGIDENRKFTVLPYMGFGCASSIDRKETCFSFNVGATALFRISPDIHLFTELKGSLLNDKMDGLVGGSKGEGSTVLSAGFTFNF